MAGNLGRATDPLTHHGNQITLEERTSDPSNTEAGELWLRTDMDDGNRLATARFDDGEEIQDLPVFERGTSDEGEEEVFAVRVGGQMAFIPTIDPSESGVPQLRFRHAGQTLAFEHVPDIPDSAITRNAMDEGSGSTAPDSIGSNDLSLSGPSWASGEGNGGNHLTFDGTDDEADWSSVPVTGSDNRTFACWVNLSASWETEDQTIISVGTSSAGQTWRLKTHDDGGGLRLDIAGANYEFNLSPPTGTWIPIALTLNGNTLGDHTAYVDGDTDGASGSETINTGNDFAGLGYDASEDRFYLEGDVDDTIWADGHWTSEDFSDWVGATEGNYP